MHQVCCILKIYTCILYWCQTVLGYHEEVLPECEHNHPGEERDPGEEAHQRQDRHVLAVGQLELGRAKQDGEHDQNLEL